MPRAAADRCRLRDGCMKFQAQNTAGQYATRSRFLPAESLVRRIPPVHCSRDGGVLVWGGHSCPPPLPLVLNLPLMLLDRRTNLEPTSKAADKSVRPTPAIPLQEKPRNLLRYLRHKS